MNAMLDELMRLHAAATQGTMQVAYDDDDGRGGWVVVPSARGMADPMAWTGGGSLGENDARLIAAAVNALPALLRVARAAWELQMLKDDRPADYEQRKPLAWAELRAALAESGGAMNYIEAAFAGIPPEEWPGEPLTIGAAVAAVLTGEWPGPLPTGDMRASMNGNNATNDQRREAATARIVEMQSLFLAAPPEEREPIARRFGYSSVESAYNAVRKWRQRRDKQA